MPTDEAEDFFSVLGLRKTLCLAEVPTVEARITGLIGKQPRSDVFFLKHLLQLEEVLGNLLRCHARSLLVL